MIEVYSRDPWRSIFSEIKSMFDDTMGAEFQNRGLKKLISKPHNLMTRKDENGNIVSFSLEVVYTPFKKSDVKVKVFDNVLTVTCGSENNIKDPDMIYCGISNQSYTFSIPLTDNVDLEKITARAEDGILYLDLPIKKPVITEDPAPRMIEVK